jgi:hypothetical protein
MAERLFEIVVGSNLALDPGWSHDSFPLARYDFNLHEYSELSRSIVLVEGIVEYHAHNVPNSGQNRTERPESTDAPLPFQYEPKHHFASPWRHSMKVIWLKPVFV